MGFSCDIGLVALSVIVAMAASYTALDLTGRVALAQRSIAWLWLVEGAVALGTGVWSMHFIGMLALRMPISPGFDPLLSAVSLLVAIATFGFALYLVGRKSLGTRLQFAGTVVIGAGICGIHYTGMVAMGMLPQIRYEPRLFGASLSITVVASVVALWLAAALRNQAEEKSRTWSLLLESDQKYRALLDATTDAVILVDEANVIHFANPAVTQIFGYRLEDLIGMDAGFLYPERLRQNYRLVLQRYLDTGTKIYDWKAVEIFGRRHDGGEISLETAFSEVVLEGKRLFASFMRDISERKERESRILRLSRVRDVLSGINNLIVRARRRDELFDGACRIAVEKGQFLLSMIAVVVEDQVRPVALYGKDEGYVAENIRASLSPADPLGLGPTATALRERRACVCNDIAADPGMGAWREAALKRGYRSAVSLPLLENAQLAGSISLYSAEPGFFDADEMILLDELAGDISHSLDFIARDEQLDYLAYYDPLTRLANAKLFAQRLEHFLHIARQERRTLALLYLDLSQFKAINDLIGRGGGDGVLKQMADRMVGFTGDPSHVARVGGDRFAVLVWDYQAAGGVQLHSRLEQLRAALGRPIKTASQELRVAVKTGIAMFAQDADDADSLQRNAEAALKMAKSGSKAHLFYTREMSARIGEKLSLEAKLRQAFEHAEFVLHYQPKVALANGAICGVEALIRWASPELGLVPPNRFIPLLEETGLIVEVGHWALQQAAADHRSWLIEGMLAPRIAVNLSPIQLHQADFVETIRGVIGRVAGDTVGIDLEITESVLMHDIESLVAKLRAVRDMGVSIAIDDFGTGYSSLAYLNKLPINAIKIDRSFIVQMADSADTMNIVSTIVTLAHSMRLKVIAEGVDSPEQLKFLRLLRCDEMQGFLFSKGLPAQELAILLREDRRLALG